MRRAVLSHPLPVVGLVSHYLTNYLIGYRPLLKRQDCSCLYFKIENYLEDYLELALLSQGYARLKGMYQYVTHPFATPPIKYRERTTCMPKIRRQRSS